MVRPNTLTATGLEPLGGSAPNGNGNGVAARPGTPMNVQLWSHNYDPEPTGIGPLSTVFAEELTARGHRVTVVAAHPHYPDPVWGPCWRPYRQRRNGVDVIRLPLWAGRASAVARVRQELTFTAAVAAVAPRLATPDVMVVVSPSFPALGPAMLNAKLRNVPWVLWLQDILPDGATATGLLSEGRLTSLARRFEQLAYRSATRIVVISDSFASNLHAKGVSDRKIVRIYNPATQPALALSTRGGVDRSAPTVLTMGNIGRSQNLVAVTQAFERSSELWGLGARLVIAGDGVAGDKVRAAITTDRVEVTGVLGRAELDRRLAEATVALVSQSYDGVDFNVPSKLMNFMARGLPIVACVRPESEVARLVRQSGGGWATDSLELDRSMSRLAEILREPVEMAVRGRRSGIFAAEHFMPKRFGDDFERTIRDVVDPSVCTLLDHSPEALVPPQHDVLVPPQHDVLVPSNAPA
jgi:colanic acid biosynthesis glycosyl transferase WcaI